MAEHSLPEESIFAQALEIGPAAERAAFLDRACGDNPSLRAEVESLLRAHERSGDLLDLPEQSAATLDEPLTERPGTVIGPYKLMEQIGEGGMGLVFVAEQQQPVRRKVALKVIKPGMDTRQVVARFEAERQALALMDHPNIAKVHDGGQTASGRPYFVMELVKGVPITAFCDQIQVPVRERLGLFVSVCQAVQHAHQKGVIHRDLKPSNVLVASHDGKPVVKVIDFGVAKAVGQQLTDKTIYTQFAQLIGTPLYMSPEQAGLSSLDVDTRSDVYSLGVLLYELLTGTTPFDRERFHTVGYDEMRRIIREEEPPRPSRRLSTLGQAATTISTCRQSDPKRLSQLFRGELDWVVMRALEKGRNRRYESASAFAADVRRYLADEPVLAAPPNAWYRLKKFARRHRAALITAGTMALLVVTGAAVSTWQAIRATQAETNARKRLAQVEKGNEIITSIFIDLDIRKVKEKSEPLEAVLAKRLVKAGEELEGEAVGDPLVVARLQNRLGLALMGLGYWRDAIPLFAKARETFTAELGADHADTLMSLSNLGRAYHDDGQLDLALPLLKKTLERKKATLGADDLDTLLSMNNLAGGYWAAGKPDLALPLWEEVLRLRKAKLGPDDPDTLESMNNLALGYQDVGKPNLALPLFEETWKRQTSKLGADHPDTLKTMHNVAAGYMRAGKLDLALPLLENTLKLRKAKLGADHPGTLESMNALAAGYFYAGKPDLALALFEETLKLRKAKLGADHPATLSTMSSLGRIYTKAGKLDLALPLLEVALKLKKGKLGADHRETLVTMSNLGLAYQAAGRLDRALPLLEDTLRLRRAKLGPDDSDTLVSMVSLGAGYQAARKLDLALPLLEEALTRRKTKLGADHPDTLGAMNNLATCYQAAGKLDRALPLLEETLRLRKAKLGPDHPDTLVSMHNLAGGYYEAGNLHLALPLAEEAAAGAEKLRFHLEGAGMIVHGLTSCYVKLKRFDQAEVWMRKWSAVVKERSGANSTSYAGALSVLGLNLLRQKKWTDAEVVVRECLAIRRKHAPDVWTTFNTCSVLGGALLGQKKYAAAEPLLLEGYEGMKQRAAKIPAAGKVRLTEALERLVQLYAELGMKDKADEWRHQLEAPKKPSAR